MCTTIAARLVQIDLDSTETSTRNKNQIKQNKLEMGKQEISAQTVLSRRGRLTRPRRHGEEYVEVSMATAAQTSVLKDIGRYLPVKDIIAGGLARAASQSTIHPLDTVKVRMQATLKGVSPSSTPPPIPPMSSATRPMLCRSTSGWRSGR